MYRGLLHKDNAALLVSHLQKNELYHKKFDGKIKLSKSGIYDVIKLEPFLSGLPVEIGIYLQSLGGKINFAEIERGFLSQNIEDELAGLNFQSAVKKIACLNFDNPLPYELLLITAMEELYDKSVKKSNGIFRAISLEASRIKHHLKVLNRIFSHIQSLSCLNLVKISQKNIIDIFNQETLRENMEILNDLKENFLKCTIAHTYLTKVANITSHVAASYGLTGLYLRANRIKYDVRDKSDPRIHYPHKPKICIADQGDLWSRCFLRIEEVQACLEWLLNILSEYEPIHEATDFSDEETPKKTMATSLLEGPEGDLKINLFFDKNSKKFSYRIKTPAYFIAQALPHFLIKKNIDEISLVLTSLGIRGTEVDK